MTNWLDTEPDSDPDFNPGSYIPEPSKASGKGKRKAPATGTATRRGRKRKGGDSDYADEGPRPRKSELEVSLVMSPSWLNNDLVIRQQGKAPGLPNPLTKYFGKLPSCFIYSPLN